MTIEQTLLQEIEESKRWLNLEKDESTYKRDLAKRIEIINWVNLFHRGVPSGNGEGQLNSTAAIDIVRSTNVYVS